MSSIVGSFPEVEAAYRRERISASFRDHAASPHRFAFRWHRHDISQVAVRPLRAA